MQNHPRWLASAYLVVGAGGIVVEVLDRSPHRTWLPALLILAGLFWLGHVPLRVDGRTLVVPKRFWGGRSVDADEITAIEMPASVWSTGPSRVVLDRGERVLLRGADRERAERIATELGIEIVRVDAG